MEGDRSLLTGYLDLQTDDGVKFYKTPDAILQRQLEVYDEVVKKKSADNPLFKEILEFADRLCQAGDALGAGHGGQSAHGSRPLLRGERGREHALKQSQTLPGRHSARVTGWCPALPKSSS